MLSSHLGALQIQREKCQPVISQEEKSDIPRMSAAGNWEQHGQKKSYTEASIPGAQQLPIWSMNLSFGEESIPRVMVSLIEEGDIFWSVNRLSHRRSSVFHPYTQSVLEKSLNVCMPLNAPVWRKVRCFLAGYVWSCIDEEGETKQYATQWGKFLSLYDVTWRMELFKFHSILKYFFSWITPQMIKKTVKKTVMDAFSFM